MKKKHFILVGIVCFMAFINISFFNTGEKASDLTLNNIRLLEAHAMEELGTRCSGGCQYTGDSHDICTLCSTCNINWFNAEIGWTGQC